MFLKHFQEHRKALYAFIFALVTNAADTEDIFQETCIILWRKFDQFKPDSNFRAWAKQIARNLIMDYRKKHKRRPVKHLDDQMIDLLTFRYEPIQNEIETRLETLKHCVQKLNYRDHTLIARAYKQQESVKSIASAIGVSVQRIYKRLGTIHNTLLRCIQITMSSGDKTV